MASLRQSSWWPSCDRFPSKDKNKLCQSRLRNRAKVENYSSESILIFLHVPIYPMIFCVFIICFGHAIKPYYLLPNRTFRDMLLIIDSIFRTDCRIDRWTAVLAVGYSKCEFSFLLNWVGFHDVHIWILEIVSLLYTTP